MSTMWSTTRVRYRRPAIEGKRSANSQDVDIESSNGRDGKQKSRGDRKIGRTGMLEVLGPGTWNRRPLKQGGALKIATS